MYVNYFILKSNYNEFDENPFFEVTRNWSNFRLRISYIRVPYDKRFQAAVSYKLVSYMRFLTVCELRTTEAIL